MLTLRMFGPVVLLFATGMTGFGSASGEKRPVPALVAPSSRPGPSSTQEQTAPRSIVSVKDGRLSVRTQNHLLGWVLEEISSQGRIAIIVADGVQGQRIAAQFEDLPLEEGLRQLLRDHDIFFFYTGAAKTANSLSVVWVYPRGRGRGLEPVPPEVWASTKEVEGNLAHPDPDVRSRAVEALVERKGDRAMDVVLKALKDKENRVRVQALYAAVISGVELPADSLIGLALRDPSPDIRFLALRALEGRPQAREIAKAAQADPSSHVRNKAREILGLKPEPYRK